ncbi:hypothetical protein [Planotetraspora silvatica]|uniref:hypothetical protein n=1 Tax=Planotetraspora silvatica TaxID=234614 RepID=UPI0019517905|nr:hypothetical protein [Planotetraspora silvatica]
MHRRLDAEHGDHHAGTPHPTRSTSPDGVSPIRASALFLLSGPLGPGGSVRLPVDGGAQLGNSGGAITLLDPAGLKVHGVSSAKQQARREGWTITF